MTHDDDHIATVIHDSYLRPVTTAEVADVVAEIIREHEAFRTTVIRRLGQLEIAAYFAGALALAAAIGSVVIR